MMAKSVGEVRSYFLENLVTSFPCVCFINNCFRQHVFLFLSASVFVTSDFLLCMYSRYMFNYCGQ